jgi:hypothetical protein
MTESERLIKQIVANVQRLDTPPSQIAKAALEIISKDPTVTVEVLAGKFSKGVEWLKDVMKLQRLKSTKIQAALDSGIVSLANAVRLASLPENEQESFLDQAQTMNAADFTGAVQSRLSAIREAKAKGGKVEEKFAPKPILRTAAAIQAMLQNPSELLGTMTNIKSVPEAVTHILQWTISFDPATIETRRVAWQDSQDKKAAKAAELAAAREKRKAEAGATATAAD